MVKKDKNKDKKPIRPGPDHPASPQNFGQPGMNMQPVPQTPKGTIVIGVGPEYLEPNDPVANQPGAFSTKILDVTGSIPNEVGIIQQLLNNAIRTISATPLQLEKKA